jgi:hypothetical protein
MVCLLQKAMVCLLQKAVWALAFQSSSFSLQSVAHVVSFLTLRTVVSASMSRACGGMNWGIL